MKRISRYIGNSLIVILLLTGIYICFRIYLFASCVIPTYSMSPTLLGGDYIITSLQIPGRRIWRVDSLGHMFVCREKGIRCVQRKDVVVFNFPFASQNDKLVLEPNLFYCKRCVAIPGDIYQWTLNGKEESLYLPRAGDNFLMDSVIYSNYRLYIEYETNKCLIKEENKYLLADSIISSYRFQHDYYFMRGDNEKDSYDSRFWGLLPDDFILGIGQFIWFSKNPNDGKIRWNRMFKRI